MVTAISDSLSVSVEIKEQKDNLRQLLLKFESDLVWSVLLLQPQPPYPPAMTSLANQINVLFTSFGDISTLEMTSSDSNRRDIYVLEIQSMHYL